jgi:hypothetical protein
MGICCSTVTAYVHGPAASISNIFSTNNIMLKINYGYQLDNFDRFKVLYPHKIKANIYLLTFRKAGFKSELGN